MHYSKVKYVTEADLRCDKVEWEESSDGIFIYVWPQDFLSVGLKYFVKMQICLIHPMKIS